ncbi:hypothetical protein SDC9_209421 [bioreactor metagenome]|uniref:Uncharacterized protein n=1 Tax=bioreactor metagenome TaxID=1076179 RepID=A0A645JG78_9ZZZZ
MTSKKPISAAILDFPLVSKIVLVVASETSQILNTIISIMLRITVAIINLPVSK